MHARSWAAVAGIAAVVAGGWWWTHPAETPSHEDPSLLFERAWIGSHPESRRDLVEALIVLRSPKLGVFQRASHYRLEAERFDHRYQGGDRRGELRLTFPQDGRRARVRFSVRRCDELPPFELCLDLDHNPWGGPRRYYAMIETAGGPAFYQRIRRRLAVAIR